MKILLTTDWYKPIVNGVVTSVINLKKELEERGHEVRILTLARTYESYQEDGVFYIKSLNLEKIYPNARAVLPHIEPLLQELIAWGPDLVHSQCEFMTFRYAVKISKKCRCPLLHTYHTVYEDYIHYIPGRLSEYRVGAMLEKKFVAGFSRNVLKKTNQVIVPTGKVEQILRTYQVTEPVSVIPTGIDLQSFSHSISKEEKENMKKKWNIPLENKVLVSVGRLAREKNLEEILRYFANLLQEEGMEKLTLLIAGDGPDRERLEGLASALGLENHVVFTGMIPPEEVSKYYQLGDVFVCASTSETQGITYIEALASGVPVLCRKDACLEAVVAEGCNGFQYESFAYFKMHLQYLLESEERRQAMGEQAKETAYLYSTWNFCTMAEKLYREVIYRKYTWQEEKPEPAGRRVRRSWAALGDRKISMRRGA